MLLERLCTFSDVDSLALDYTHTHARAYTHTHTHTHTHRHTRQLSRPRHSSVYKCFTNECYEYFVTFSSFKGAGGKTRTIRTLLDNQMRWAFETAHY